jgi:hypothetical protein
LSFGNTVVSIRVQPALCHPATLDPLGPKRDSCCGEILVRM